MSAVKISKPGAIVYMDKSKADRARKNLVAEKVFSDLAETFKAMGDPTRTKLLHILAHEELCVGDLAALLDMTPSAISHQLRLLRTMRLVRARRAGRATYYALDDDHIRRLLVEGLKHVTGKDENDRRR